MNIVLFPPTCTNLIVGTSNCGKTYLVQHIVKNFNLFFPHHLGKGGEERGESFYGEEEVEEEVPGSTQQYNQHYQQEPSSPISFQENEKEIWTHVYVVHCNDKTPRWIDPIFTVLGALTFEVIKEGYHYEEKEKKRISLKHRLKINQFDIEEFNLNLVAPHSLVVFDDVNVLHESITTTINVGSHHIPLLAVFVITQNIIGNVHYTLTKLCHRVIFCCNTVNALDAANNVLRKQVSDRALRQHLQSILTFCHKEKTTFLLELNNLATWPTSNYGYSHLVQIKPPFPYCLVYSMKESVWKRKMPVHAEPWSSMETEEEKNAFKELVKNAKHLPENTMIMLPLFSLDLKLSEKENERGTSGSGSGKCYTQAVWEEVKAIVIADIQLAFPPNKWRNAIALAEGIFGTDALCVSRDGKFMWIKDRVKIFEGHPRLGPHHGKQNQHTFFKRRRRRRRRKKRSENGQFQNDASHQHTLPFVLNGGETNNNGEQVTILNFIQDVQRQAMPKVEKKLTLEWRQYRAIVQVLKARGVPNFLFKNKIICK